MFRPLPWIAFAAACGVSHDVVEKDATPGAPAAPAPPVEVAAGLQPSGPVAGMPSVHVSYVSDDRFCSGTALTTTIAGPVAANDEPLRAFFAVSAPTGLSFDPDDKSAVEESLRRFNAFVETMKTLGATATKHYEEQLRSTDPAVSVPAAARISQISHRFATVMLHMEIPEDVRTGEFAEDKINAFCDKMEDVAEPLLQRAQEAATQCAARASEAGPGWWENVCRPTRNVADR